MPAFENEAVLVIDKRPGYLSVLSRLGEKDPRPCEYIEWQKKLGIRLWSVHRLDEDVSGLLVLAKNPKAHSLLSQAFESRFIRKKYEAWTEGSENPLPEVDKVNHWESTLLRGKKRAYEKPFGKKSVTEAVLKRAFVEKETPLLQWNLFPLTGRSHQLRYECSKHGFPVLGDSLYGSKVPFGLSGAIALRAIELDFSGCTSREILKLPLRIEASPLTLINAPL